MSGFTKGPWQLHEHFVKGQWGNADRWVCEITCPNNNLIVAEIPEYRSYPEDTPAVEANARLIAAAPELYEALASKALNELLGMVEDSGGAAMWGAAVRFMELRDAALSKAAGEGV